MATEPATTYVQIARISESRDYQTRHVASKSGLNDAHVDDLAEALIEWPDMDLEPLWLVERLDRDTGETELMLLAGFHRRAAYVKAGRTDAPARVWKGLSHSEAFVLAASSNAKNQLVWSRPERQMTVRQMFADDEMGRWSFERIAKVVRMRASLVRAEYATLYPGVTEREVEGADGKVYSVRIGAVAPAFTAPPDLGFMDDGSDEEAPEQVLQIPSAQSRSVSAPQPAYGAPRSNGLPSPASGLSSPAVASRGDVIVPKPRAPHPTQQLVELNISYQLASDEEGQFVSDGTTDPRPMPAAVRLELIRWLQAQA